MLETCVSVQSKTRQPYKSRSHVTQRQKRSRENGGGKLSGAGPKILLQGVITGCVNEGALVTLVQVDADEKSALLTRQAVSDDVAAGTKFQPCGASANDSSSP